MNSSNLNVTAETIDSIVHQTFETYVYDLITTSAFVLICYATVLNIGHEVEYIWRKRFSLPSLLYFFARYGSIIDQSINLAVNFALESLPVCNILADAGNSMSGITSLGVQGLLIARAYSISGGNKTLGGVLGISFSLWFILYLVVIIKFNGCANTGTDIQFIIVAIGDFITIFLESFTFLVCMWYLWGIFRSKRESGIQNSEDLVSTLVRQSILRCCFVLVTTVACAIIELAVGFIDFNEPFPVVLTSIIYYRESVSAILVADFTLNLRRQNVIAVDHVTLPSFQFQSVLQHVHESFLVELRTPEHMVRVDTETENGEDVAGEGANSESDRVDNGTNPSQTQITVEA